MNEDAFQEDANARWRSAFSAVLAVSGAFLTLTHADAHGGREGRDKRAAEVVVAAVWLCALAWGSAAAHSDRQVQTAGTASWQVAVGLFALAAAGVVGFGGPATSLLSDWKAKMVMVALQAAGALLLAHRAVPKPSPPDQI